MTFDGSGSQSAVEITAYTWDFGDGAQANGAAVTHAYSTGGDYQVVLTVTDANNLSNATTWVITILAQATPQPPPPPVAVIIAPPMGDTASPVTFDGSASTSDVGITSYQWNMGNNVILEGPVVLNTFPDPGNFTVTLIVTDAFGQQGTTTWDIMVYPAMPAPPEVTQPIATPPTPDVAQPTATPSP